MKLTIDNMDGAGPRDYTALLAGNRPLTMRRRLNTPSDCSLVLAAGVLPAPAAGARVRLEADNGTVLFTGYTLAAATSVYCGMATCGPAYELQVECASDELIFDARVSAKTIECVGTSVGTLLDVLTTRALGTLPSISGDATGTAVGGFQPEAGKSWSENVGALANAARAAYRVLDGAVEVSSLGARSHTFAEADGSLDRGAFSGTRTRAAVNDVTVCGKEEPQAYVTEIFVGDGVTSSFELGEAPLLEKATLLSDTFESAVLDPQRWLSNDAGGHISMTSRGLTFGGGQGGALASTVTAVDAVELGGVLLLELMGLEPDSAGEGYFAALSNGSQAPTGVLAGFHLRPAGAALVLVPIVAGAEAGATATLQTGHSYTLRLRYRCKDRQRALQTYASGSGSGAGAGVARQGGGPLTAPCDLLLEVQETTGGAEFPVSVLFDGSVDQAPSSSSVLVANSIGFLGSVASFELTRPGEAWVTCAPAGSAPATQRLGVSGQSAQAKLASTGRLSFFPGSVPAAGALIRATYRLGGLAIARMATGESPARSLIVTVESPLTRSSADCENAALVTLATSTWPDGAWKGAYSCWNPQNVSDIWPGDMLALEWSSAGIATSMLVRTVEIEGSPSCPEMLLYRIGFANEWAEPVAIRLREGSPENAWLPPYAATASTALASLRDLQVASVNASQIMIETGVAPPAGGGFEVRRSDWKFGAGDGADLVLRTPAASFSIVREAAVERYYVRMFDGSTPANYSRFSSAVFVNAAMQ